MPGTAGGFCAAVVNPDTATGMIPDFASETATTFWLVIFAYIKKTGRLLCLNATEVREGLRREKEEERERI